MTAHLRSMANDSLDSSIQLSLISPKTKCEILNLLWDIDLQPQHYSSSQRDHDIYFSYYVEQCNDALYESGKHLSARTHRDIIEVARSMKNFMARDDIAKSIKQKLSESRQEKEALGLSLRQTEEAEDDELVSGTIDLTASLLLMMNFSSFQYSFDGRERILWTDGAHSVKTCIHDHFKNCPTTQEIVRLEPVFNALNLIRIAGLEIEWTNNMGDHLRLLDEDNKVAIFHHASFLECQNQSTIFPPGFVEETLRTIALLFPSKDADSRKWLKKLAKAGLVDRKMLKQPPIRTSGRQIAKFHFWNDRLVILKQRFDEAEPGTLSQWWHDRRKGVQWYTFWVAAVVLILTVFFGLVQSVEGALQVYKAFQG